MNNQRGSIWGRWDLHFHTPSSYDYENKSVTNKDIIDVLIANEIKVIAITDHHVIDTNRIKELQQLGKDKITILPGIEFRAELGGSDSIHFIGIFPEYCDLEDLWIKLQSKCEITKKDIEGKGGDRFIHCDLKETSNLIHSLGGLVSVHAGGKANTIENITNTLPYKTALKTDLVLNYIDILELGKETDQDDYNNIVFPAIQSQIPMILCSDNHNIKNYTIKQKLWIKADPTFEGLKQIIFEPEQRVYIGENPFSKSKKLKIESFTISDSSNFQLINQKIPLNSEMVSIIGGRGSGKSALLETLTFCFGKNKQPFKWDFSDSDIKINGEYIYYLKKNGSNAVLTIEYRDLDNNILPLYKKEIQDNDENFCDYPLLYLGQNQIELYSNDSSKIHELAFEAVLKNSGLTDEINSIQNEIKAYDAELIGLTKEIEASRLQLLSFNIEKIRTEKSRLEKEIALLSSKETQETLEKLGESRIKKDNYIKAKDLTQDILDDLKKFSNNLETKALALNNILPNIGIEDLLKFDFIKSINDSENLLQKINTSKIPKEHEANILEAEKKLEGKTEISAAYFDGLKSKIEEIDKSLEIYKKEEEYLNYNINYRHEHLITFDELYSELNLLYSKAIKIFSQTNSTILKSLKLESSIGFDEKKLVTSLFEKVDRRKIKELEKFKNEVLGFNNIKSNKAYIDLIKEFELNEGNFNYFYDGKKTFEEIAYKNYYSLSTKISYEVESNNFRQLNNLSLGQKGTVLLKLFLSLGNNCPIIIDQPEDHLDNHFIYSDLVTTLKKAKEKRQVIIVTHDANIVVNGDSEQIIVAEYKNNSINYSLSGSIENVNVKDAMTKILEGGNEAFIKREKKYQLSNKKVKIK
ncbi:MAG: hypothetical protein SFY56_11875 [Bacteroidota bacterium]|nr:hypothetical protein [Bacteroidota bacterium]